MALFRDVREPGQTKGRYDRYRSGIVPKGASWFPLIDFAKALNNPSRNTVSGWGSGRTLRSLFFFFLIRPRMAQRPLACLGSSSQSFCDPVRRHHACPSLILLFWFTSAVVTPDYHLNYRNSYDWDEQEILWPQGS